MCEEWRPVKGYEGIYEVSNTGRVRSLPRQMKKYYFKGRELKQCTTNSKRPQVCLSYGGIKRNISVQTLVAEAFE